MLNHQEPTPAARSISERSPAEIEATLARIWCEVLRVPDVDRGRNFFAAGGDSLLVAQLADRVNREFFPDSSQDRLPITTFFTHTTVRALARQLREPGVVAAGDAIRRATPVHDSIAIVGMAGRFPGCEDVASFWEALREGGELLRELTPQELSDIGLDPQRLPQGYVTRAGTVPSPEWFDAGYFDLSPAEVALMQPEQRVLLECAVEALDEAGYARRNAQDRIGVFVGARALPERGSESHTAPAMSGQGVLVSVVNTSAANRISYLLDLTGPSLSVDTACSSSLVAVHQACRALQSGECELALAGGTSQISVPARGYQYEEGNILSSDGRCTPFDRDATGTVFSEGSGLLLLKPLQQALRDGDPIHAVIRGTAINNDGRGKAGYTAPAMTGQVRVIRAALEAAGVSAGDIGFVETHGTGTRIGDQIELEALTTALRASGERTFPCVIGALKSNAGHMEAAAGVAGLVKAALILKQGRIPPIRGLVSAHAALTRSSDLLCVNQSEIPWQDRAPRLAGVSSFGIGGTNAHAVLEAPPPCAASTAGVEGHVLPVSARSESALIATCERLARHLGSHPGTDLADVAYVLQTCKPSHACRRAFICRSVADAAAQLAHANARSRGESPSGTVRVRFAFPIQTERAVQSILALYSVEPEFRAALADVIASAPFELQIGLRQRLAANGVGSRASIDRSSEAATASLVQLALARFWVRVGVVPRPAGDPCSGDSDPARAIATMHEAGQRDCDPTQSVVLLVLGASEPEESPPMRASRVIACLPTGLDVEEAVAVPKRVAASLWEAGAPLDWNRLRVPGVGRRIHLPADPFERRRHPFAFMTATQAAGRDVPNTEASLLSRVRALWVGALGVEQIEPHDDFFELGGDSLLAVRLAQDIRVQLGIDLPLRDFYRAPTVAGLVEVLAARADSA